MQAMAGVNKCQLCPPIVLCSLVVNVYLPKDRVTNAHQGYGFVEFRTEDDADYVSHCLHVTRAASHVWAVSCGTRAECLTFVFCDMLSMSTAIFK